MYFAIESYIVLKKNSKKKKEVENWKTQEQSG